MKTFFEAPSTDLLARNLHEAVSGPKKRKRRNKEKKKKKEDDEK